RRKTLSPRVLCRHQRPPWISAHWSDCLNFPPTRPVAVTPSNPFNPRRLALGAAKKLIFENEDPETALERIAGLSSIDNRGASSPESKSMSRTRTTILNNLDEMYREAFERAKASGDQ